MTTTTEIGKAQLRIHNLNKAQYNDLDTVSETELYAVDLGLTGGKMLMSDNTGDIVEGDISDVIPVSSEDAGKALVTNGTDADWAYTAVIKTWID